METLDTLARIIGYGAMGAGAIWFLGSVSRGRAEAKAATLQSQIEKEMRDKNPEAYNELCEERQAIAEIKLGLPVDPAVKARILAKARAASELLESLKG